MMDISSDRYDNNCSSCKAIQGIISLTCTPRIFETPRWVIEHVHPTSIKGWLVIVLNRHCSALHQLTAEEFAELAQLMQTLCRALHEILDTQKEYVIQFAEAEGFDHVHFHVVARLRDWPESLTGDRVFSGLGEEVEIPLSSEQLTPLAMNIRDYLIEQTEAL